MVSGGGPVGLIFALDCIHSHRGQIFVRIYDSRWKQERNGNILWKTQEEGNTRRSQVVTLQDDVIGLLPQQVADALFSQVNERVWPTSKNIPIREVEDRLLELLQTDNYKG